MAEHYRTGRRNHRVIYLQVGSEPSDDDVMVGSFDTAQLAERFVDAVNGLPEVPEPSAPAAEEPDRPDAEAVAFAGAMNALAGLPCGPGLAGQLLRAIRAEFPDADFDPASDEHRARVAVRAGYPHAGPVIRSGAGRALRAYLITRSGTTPAA